MTYHDTMYFSCSSLQFMMISNFENIQKPERSFRDNAPILYAIQLQILPCSTT